MLSSCQTKITVWSPGLVIMGDVVNCERLWFRIPAPYTYWMDRTSFHFDFLLKLYLSVWKDQKMKIQAGVGPFLTKITVRVYIWKTGVASNCAKALWDEVLYLPNCQTNLVIVLRALSLLFRHFINTTAYHLGRYKPSTPCTNELHGKSYWRFDRRPVELFIALWSC